MLRTREVPTAPLVLYAVGAIPISLRAFVPEAVLDLGLAVLAVGIAWLAIWLFNRSDRIATWTMTGTAPTHRRYRLTVGNTAGPLGGGTGLGPIPSPPPGRQPMMLNKMNTGHTADRPVRPRVAAGRDEDCQS